MKQIKCLLLICCLFLFAIPVVQAQENGDAVQNPVLNLTDETVGDVVLDSDNETRSFNYYSVDGGVTMIPYAGEVTLTSENNVVLNKTISINSGSHQIKLEDLAIDLTGSEKATVLSIGDGGSPQFFTLLGTNTFSSRGAAIYAKEIAAWQSLSFNGSGSLSATSTEDDGIYVDGRLNVFGGSLSGNTTALDKAGVLTKSSTMVEGGSLTGESLSGSGLEMKFLTLIQGSVHSRGQDGIKCAGTVAISGGNLLADGQETGINAQAIAITGGSVNVSSFSVPPVYSQVNAATVNRQVIRTTISGLPAGVSVHPQNINSEALNFTKSIPKPLESYGLNSVATDENGHLYFYFPTGTIFSGKVLTVTLAGKNYPGVALGSDEAGYQITLTDSPVISYQSHVQNFGWENTWLENGQLSGTTGEGLKLEAFRIKSDLDGLGVKYRGHIQNIGWGKEVSDGEVCGTTGQGLRLEAVEISLTGDQALHYQLYYRVHVADIGWMDWAENGAMAGTHGRSKPIEGIQIVVLPSALGDENEALLAQITD